MSILVTFAVNVKCWRQRWSDKWRAERENRIPVSEQKSCFASGNRKWLDRPHFRVWRMFWITITDVRKHAYEISEANRGNEIRTAGKVDRPIFMYGKASYSCWLRPKCTAVVCWRDPFGWFPAWLFLRPWRWSQYVPQKRQWTSTGLHGVTS
jgi:hypothetical protein